MKLSTDAETSCRPTAADGVVGCVVRKFALTLLGKRWVGSAVFHKFKPQAQVGGCVGLDVDGVSSYLQKFGYLPEDDHRAASLRTEESLTQAIRQFQKMAGVPITGVLDNATQEMMSLPRCGNKDQDLGIKRLRRKRYALQGSKWARSDITYKISSYPRGVSRDAADKEIHSALKIWGDVTNLNFIPRPYSRRVDINVLFTRRDHGDGNPFDGRGGTLAHAFFPQYGGDAHFDNDEEWTINMASGINMFQVAAHEFGHSLGLSHSSNRSALMAPFYRGYQKNFRLGSDDVRGIQRLYGVPTRSRSASSGSRSSTPKVDEGPVLSVPKLCVDPKIDAMFTGNGHETYIFKGDDYYKIEPWGIAKGYPRSISEDWYPLKGPIDSALYWANGYTYLFKGSKYYKFYGRRYKYSRSIRSGFMGIPDNIDASFVWSKNKITYFIKGNQYWRYSTNEADPEYPKPLSLWGTGMPSRIDAAVRWRNDKTYFFRGDNYYRYNDYEYMIDDSYPRSTAQWWLGCPAKETVRNIHQIQDLNGIPEKPIPDFSGGQSEYIQLAMEREIQSDLSTEGALREADKPNATLESPFESSEKESDRETGSVSTDERSFGDGSGLKHGSRNFSIRLYTVSCGGLSLFGVLVALVPSFLLRSVR
ncbi:hypothetical protein RRG08_047754 [Elysia crispata]|uniref:Peptidase metallopeptidase domain-containing protein n=1 Tax=Elysia crispata TaxID=231223 RepID=A0AAE1DTM5_9GAST|nr:hypothetical protein RRG08_047754 [Elysia crispata]